MQSRRHLSTLTCLASACGIALLLGSAVVADEGKGLPLVRSGKSEYVIVRSGAAGDAERFAATELRDYLQKATGSDLPIVEESETPRTTPAIYVGPTEFALKHGVDPAQLDGQQWIIESVGQNLILAGGHSVGTLYAVYEFLESQLGCRWLDRDTEIVPRHDALIVPPLKIHAKPAFWYRSITTGLWPMNLPKEVLDREALFLSRNKSTMWPARFGAIGYGSPGSCHTFYEYSKDFPADHPEYFSLGRDGKRERATSSGGPGQLCLSNPEVRKLLLAKLKTYIVSDREAAVKSGNPPPRIYDISANDNHNHICLCPNCMAIVEREEATSGLLLDCINELADGVKQEYPDVLVMTFAYTMTLKTPKTVRPRDNVVIRLAQLNAEWTPAGDPGAAPHYPDFFRPLSHPVNHVAAADIVAWSKISKRLAIWDYWVIYLLSIHGYPTNDRFPTPNVNTACLQPDLQYYLENRVDNVFIECEYSERSAFQPLKLWLGQKLLQDPNQDVASLRRDFLEGYYGAASPPMTTYLDELEKAIAAVPETIKLSAESEHLRPYLTLDFFIAVHRLLTDAEQQAAPDPKSLLHVQQEWVPVAAAIVAMWPQLVAQLPEGQAMPFDREALLTKYVDSRHAVVREFYRGEVPEDMRRKIDDEQKALRRTSDGS